MGVWKCRVRSLSSPFTSCVPAFLLHPSHTSFVLGEMRFSRLIGRVRLVQDPLNLDMEGILFRSLRSHANALIMAFHKRVVDHPPIAAMYDLEGGDIQLVEEGPLPPSTGWWMSF